MPDQLPTHAGPFALGTFAAEGDGFPGLVTGARVRDLSDLVPSVRALVEDWDSWLPRLGDLAGADGGTWYDLADLRVLTPIEPGQILQSGANYRKHVVDLVAAEKESVHGATPEEARADAESMMDERARNGVPYVFLGSPRAISGPFDDIVLPALGEQHDWELELALVIGKSGRDIAAEDAMEYVAAYTISNDLTTRDRLYRPDLKAIGTDWFTAKNADTFLPTGPFLVPHGLRRRPRRPADHPAPQRSRPPGRVHQGHDLRHPPAHRVHLHDHHPAPRRPAAHRFPGRQRRALGRLPEARRRRRVRDHRPGPPAQHRQEPRMSVFQPITHLRHVDLAVPDFARQRAFYGTTWGLTEVANDSGVAFFAAEGSPEQYIVRIREDERKRMDLVAFGAASPVAVDELHGRLGRAGVQLIGEPGVLDTPGGGYGFRFFDPDGRVVEVSADVETRAHRRIEEREAIPVRLSHCVVNSQDPEGLRDFYVRHLGFRLTDTLYSTHMGDLMYFLRCSPLHHSFAIARGPHVSLHHASFEMRGVEEYMRGTGRALRAGTRLTWGPGRHLMRRQHLLVLPRPARQHRRVHDRTRRPRRGLVAPGPP